VTVKLKWELTLENGDPTTSGFLGFKQNFSAVPFLDFQNKKVGKTMSDDNKISDADLEGVAGGKGGMSDYDKRKAKWMAEQESKPETKPETKPEIDTGK